MTGPELGREDVDDTIAGLRDHMLARDLAALIVHDPGTGVEELAALFATLRQTGDVMAVIAAGLYRDPERVEEAAGDLDGLATMLKAFLTGAR